MRKIIRFFIKLKRVTVIMFTDYSKYQILTEDAPELTTTEKELEQDIVTKAELHGLFNDRPGAAMGFQMGYYECMKDYKIRSNEHIHKES